RTQNSTERRRVSTSVTLTRWDPNAYLGDLRRRVDRVFDEVPGVRRHGWMPAIDVVRDQKRMVVRADIPGLKPDEVKIEIEDHVLTVSGKHEEHEVVEDRLFVRRERHYGSFSRSMDLPHGVDVKRITAQTHDGLLEVTIPLPDETKEERVSLTPTAV
ncbi:MAG: Hsp20/alpha crystallin family protein, partial [Solirubrobacteraceae bacterium]